MAVHEHAVATAGVNGAARHPCGDGRNGLGKIRIHRQFNGTGANDKADGRIVRGLQIGDGLGGGLAPKILNPHRIVRPVKTPEPIADQGSAGVGGVRLHGLYDVSGPGVDRRRTGPDGIGRAEGLQHHDRPTAARIGGRPGGPGMITARQTGLQIAPVGKTVIVIAEAQGKRDADLPEIGNAGNPLRPLFCDGQGGKQEGRQDGDDGDDDQQFNQRKAGAIPGPAGCRTSHGSRTR
jgi:hypothetical protein